MKRRTSEGSLAMGISAICIWSKRREEEKKNKREGFETKTKVREMATWQVEIEDFGSSATHLLIWAAFWGEFWATLIDNLLNEWDCLISMLLVRRRKAIGSNHPALPSTTTNQHVTSQNFDFSLIESSSFNLILSISLSIPSPSQQFDQRWTRCKALDSFQSSRSKRFGSRSKG